MNDPCITCQRLRIFKDAKELNDFFFENGKKYNPAYTLEDEEWMAHGVCFSLDEGEEGFFHRICIINDDEIFEDDNSWSCPSYKKDIPFCIQEWEEKLNINSKDKRRKKNGQKI